MSRELDKGNIKKAAEIGVMWPQAEECQMLLKPGKGWFLPWSLQKESDLGTP